MGIKQLYGFFLMTVMRIAGRDAAKKADVLLRYGKRIDLKHPRSLREKVIYLENHNTDPRISFCTDKWEVRSYVSSKGLHDILIPVYGDAYDSVGRIPFSAFPEKYVLKATHGCKMNYFCDDAASLDLESCKKVLSSWLRTTYGTYSGEWHYLSIPHRIYCEQYLNDADKMIDYKFHCMNGVPQFVLVCGNRHTASIGNKIDRKLYNMDWEPLPGLTEQYPGQFQKPESFQEMVRIAKTLSADFKFVRVDLYEFHQHVYFGELTFTPSNGVFSHYTDTFLNQMGETLSL